MGSMLVYLSLTLSKILKSCSTPASSISQSCRMRRVCVSALWTVVVMTLQSSLLRTRTEDPSVSSESSRAVEEKSSLCCRAESRNSVSSWTSETLQQWSSLSNSNLSTLSTHTHIITANHTSQIYTNPTKSWDNVENADGPTQIMMLILITHERCSDHFFLFKLWFSNNVCITARLSHHSHILALLF